MEWAPLAATRERLSLGDAPSLALLEPAATAAAPPQAERADVRATMRAEGPRTSPAAERAGTVRQSRPLPDLFSQGSVAPLAAWGASVVLLILLAAAAYAWRAPIMEAWPPSQRLYAALGLAPAGNAAR